MLNHIGLFIDDVSIIGGERGSIVRVFDLLCKL